MNKPLISIIIPSYNSLKYLDGSIGSALNQTYENVEIILIDDGSTDGTRDSFNKFEKHGIICRNQPNKGASAARNHGLSLAKGEYIQFLDADDILHPDKLKKQVSLMEKEDADLSFSYWENFTNDVTTSQTFRFPHIPFDSIQNGRDVIRSFGEDNWFVVPAAWLVKKELIEKAGYWNEFITNNDDGEYFSRILFWSQKVSIVKESLAFYRLTDDVSLSTMNTEQKAYSALYSWKLIHTLLSGSHDKRLLSYPKRGFYVIFLMTRNNFPKIARLFAKEFDGINAYFFLSEWKFNKIIEFLGLYNAYILKDYLNKMLKVFSLRTI